MKNVFFRLIPSVLAIFETAQLGFIQPDSALVGIRMLSLRRLFNLRETFSCELE